MASNVDSINCVAAGTVGLAKQLAVAHETEKRLRMKDTKADSVVDSCIQLDIYASALTRLRLLQRRLPKADNFRKRYRQTIKTTLRKIILQQF